MDIPINKRRFSTSKIAMILGVIILVSFIVFLGISKSTGSRLNVVKERITICEVEQGVFQENIPVNGVILPITTIFLDALEGGRVEEKYVEDGAIVSKGDPILRLSNTDLELSLVNQETAVYNLLTQMQISQNAARQNTINKLNQFTEVKNSLIEARRVFDVNKKLFEKDVISEQEFLESENNFNFQYQRMDLAQQVLKEDSLASKQELKQAKSSYHQTQKALTLMRKKVTDLVVKAPVNGQLTSLDAEIGQSITKGERLGQVDVLIGHKVRVDIDEHYISRIYAGQIGTFTFNNNPYKLIIKKVFTQVIKGRFQVDMHFEGKAPQGIRRGQTLQIKLALSDEKQTMFIPKGGFFQKTGGNWIYKLNDSGDKAHRVNIQLGTQNTNFYEVLQGLNPGDKIIISSYENYGESQELIFK